MLNPDPDAVTFDEGYSEATRRAYAADWRSFEGWCRREAATSVPAAVETVVAYIERLAETHKPASVARKLATITCVHRDKGHQSPCALRPVKVAMKRVWRKGGRRQRQALAVTFERRDEMILASRPGLGGLRDQALLSTAYDLGCRRSELVSLLAEDIERAEDGSATVLLRRSKTDQEGVGSMRYLAPSTVEAIDRWLDAAGVEIGPVFRSVTAAGRVGEGLTGGSVARTFKRLSKAAGHDPATVAGTSGHSTRVGMAQDMATAGIDLAGIMQAGNWKSPTMVARYIERLAARSGAAAKLARLQGR